MKDIKDLLFKLSSADGIGNITAAKQTAFAELSKYCETKFEGNNIIGVLKGENEDKSIMVEAHIDEVGFTVTNVDESGFLTLTKCGGIDLRSLPARKIKVHGKREVICTFCSTPPHLKNGEERFQDITELKVDSLLGSKAKDVISVGDFANYCTTPCELLNDRVTGKALDDRAGVVCVIETAKRLSTKKLPFNVLFVLSDQEEIGTRGAKTATFTASPESAICIDVSFGDGPGISADECGKMGQGAMIGFSPSLDSDMSKALLKVAKANNIPYQTEIMSGLTGTDADVVSISKSGVKTSLLSIPLRNMHTDCEIVDLKDVLSVCDIIEKYIGGAFND